MGIAIADRKNRCDFGALSPELFHQATASAEVLGDLCGLQVLIQSLRVPHEVKDLAADAHLSGVHSLYLKQKEQELP